MLRHQSKRGIVDNQNRPIFGNIFNKKAGGCDRSDDVFHICRDKIQADLHNVEKVAKNDASISFLLNTLINCQKMEIIDKFFFDEILQVIEDKLDTIHDSKHLVKLGIGLGMNNNIAKDHSELIKKFYVHCFSHRFLLPQADKNTLL